MLVVSRKENEAINVHGPSKVVIVGVRGKIVRVGIEADKSVLILRGELEPRPMAAEPIVESEVGQDIKREISK